MVLLLLKKMITITFHCSSVPSKRLLFCIKEYKWGPGLQYRNSFNDLSEFSLYSP